MRWWLAAISTLAISALSVALAPSDPAHQLRAQDRSPAAALAAMRLPEGFSAQLVAAEPLVKQPVAIEFDDRGRLWVIQYLQYPNPAELQRVQVDRYSRTRYDRVPPPPPTARVAPIGSPSWKMTTVMAAWIAATISSLA